MGMSIGIGLGITTQRRRGVFSPAALFANGEDGAWFDIDPQYLFQDDAGTTPVTAPGQPVGFVTDRSGNGNHATQATAEARPTYQTDGTLHYLHFDGVDDFLVTPTITPGTDKAQVFAGVRKLSDSTQLLIELSENSSFNNYCFGVLELDGGDTRANSSGTERINVFAVNPAPASRVYSALFSVTPSLVALRFDGASVGSEETSQGEAGNYIPESLYICAREGTSLFYEGHIYGLIARCGPNLTANEIDATELWIANKTGVAL